MTTLPANWLAVALADIDRAFAAWPPGIRETSRG